MVINLTDGLPVSYVNKEPNTVENTDTVASFIKTEKERARTRRTKIKQIWDECNNLYRGKEDWSDKEDWQSKISAPKAFNSVKQATNAFIRMLELSKKAWELDAVNPDDGVSSIRASRLTKLVDHFLTEANFLTGFQEGLESANTIGFGVWKIGWSLDDRDQIDVEPVFDESGSGQVIGEKLVRNTITEGKLTFKAIDPYHFYWLEGSELTKFTGTIEEFYITRYQLKQIIERLNEGREDKDKIKIDRIGGDTSTSSVSTADDINRFDRVAQIGSASTKGLEQIKLTEYYGPIFDENGDVSIEHGHALIANDTTTLFVRENPLWHKLPPYIGFSPLLIPHREIGVGLVEMVREVTKQFSRLANMSIDTLFYKLIPAFEAYPDAYEDESELDTGIVPGKILRRSRSSLGLPNIQPIISEDISAGSLQMMATLDRLHQEGSFVSELQSALPRLRGSQTATEIRQKSAQENTFLAALAREVDERALKPIIEMAMDTVLQYLDTNADPRVATILGLGQEELAGMDVFALSEIVQGNYIIKVHGVSEQINKIESLENLVQFMNIIGQNQEWLPYINQTELFKRILDSFPGIRDVDRLVNDPSTVEEQRIALQNSALTPEIIRTIPGFLRSIAELKRNGALPDAIPQLEAQTMEQLEANARAQEEQRQQQAELQQLQLEATKAQLKRIISGEEAGEIDKSGTA